MKQFVAVEKGVYRHTIIGIGSLEQLKPLIFKYFESHDTYHIVEVIDGFDTVLLEYEQTTKDRDHKRLGSECLVMCGGEIVHKYIAKMLW